MNILGNNANKLNEVIFENRNKNYGAYAIRSAYNDSLTKSILCLVSLVSLLFGSVIIRNKINATSGIESPLLVDDGLIKPLIYTTTLVDLKPPVVEPNQNTGATAPKGAIGTVINDNAVETNSVNFDNPVSGVGTETATGVSPVGPETSTVTSIHIESTPAVATIETVVVAEEMPEFEGGVAGLMRYVSQNIVYPPLAREIGKEGTVYVSFVVNEIGNVESVKVMRGIGYGCDEEVMRVVGKMPRWKNAGKNAGHPVKVRFNIPVSFKLR
ncbi:MAG: energy transducer TonB [Bacteroidota bacterium]|nr:energy transducer TonB [Bacteroidota bacterium]